MIEAASSVLVNSSLLRGNAEQLNAARAAGQQNTVQSVDVSESIDLPRAPYISPRVFLDNNYNKAVLQILDSETGDVLRQFPTEKTLATRASEADKAASTIFGEDDFGGDIAAQTDSSAQSLEISRSNTSIELQVSQAQVGSSSGIPQSTGVAEAQVAAAALANGAQTGASSSGAVSVTA